ncbi:MAG: CCA tRNA nucleotidyltransferase [Anaerolineae bacterium]|nr:CCA tRNA nucleotidyltransferase [Anaerolineae bacterium]
MSDLTSLLKPKQREVFDAIRDAAAETGVPAFLVGGAVRDWLLGLPEIGDLDFVVEGNAIALAASLRQRHGGDVHAYPKFGTATWRFNGVAVDLAMARRESYPHPAALPVVEPSDLPTDLLRRDFTVNAMAMRLDDFALIDPLGGQDDLQRGVMRVIHGRSFVDDPTRMLRGARYAARFKFELDAETRAALNAGLPYVRALSGERMKYDLELIFEDREPEGALVLLREWGVFEAAGIPVPPADQLAHRFRQAREAVWAGEWPLESLNLSMRDLLHAIGWGALTYNIGQLGIARWVDWIPFEHHLRDALVDLGPLSTLAAASFRARRSRLSELLRGFSGLSLFLAYLFETNKLKRDALLCEWKDWRWVKPVTTGDDLRALGLPPGPAYGRILDRLRKAWLDDEVKSYAEEQTLLQKLIEAEGV